MFKKKKKKLSVPSRCFIDDSQSAVHSPSALNSLLRVFPSLPDAACPLLYEASILCHWKCVIFPTAADLILMGDKFSFLSVTLPAKPLAPPKGTRYTHNSSGVTGPGWIPNSRAVKTYRLVHCPWYSGMKSLSKQESVGFRYLIFRS